VALRLLAMALGDSNLHFVRALAAKAIEYLNQAKSLNARPHCLSGPIALLKRNRFGLILCLPWNLPAIYYR
jgi:hypothetical protein